MNPADHFGNVDFYSENFDKGKSKFLFYIDECCVEVIESPPS